MADETKVQAEAAAQAPAKIAETVANTAEKVVAETKQVAKRERAKTQRRAKRVAAAEKTTARRTKAAARRNTRKAVRKTAAAAQERIETVTNTNFFNGFDAVPAFAPFQSLFADAGERSQEIAQRSQRECRGDGRGRPRCR